MRHPQEECKKREGKQLDEANCFLTVSPQKDSLLVNFRINGKPYSGLLDSGASVSLVSRKMLIGLKFPIRKSLTILKYGGGNRESSQGYVMLPINFEGVTKEAKFHVVGDDCPCDIILGLDFCKTFNLAIDFKPREISIVPKIKFKLQNPEHLPPKSAKVCIVKADNLKQGTAIADPFPLNEKRFGYEALGGIVEVEDNLAKIMLVNHTDNDLKLPKELTVAQEEELTEPDILERTQDSPLDWENIDINPDLTDEQKKALRKMIISNEKSFRNPTEKLTHSIARIDLIPGTVPIKQAPYRLPIALEPQIEAQIGEMLDRDLIEPSDSPWASPINVIKKRDGSFRFTVDYRKLNKCVQDVAFPIPRIDTLLTKLKDAHYFTCVDLQDGFFNISLDKASRPITAICTHVGLFQFKRLPQGLRTSPSIFVSIMDKIFKKQRDFTVVYLDDVCIFSRTFEDHLKHVDSILKRIHNHQLVAKLKKCSFAYQKLKFLGHMISHETISPDPNKVAAIKAFIEPRTKTELRSFLGLVNYYKRLVKGHSEICKPLYDITGEKAEFKFGPEQKKAFETLKNALTNDSFIKSFDPTRKTFLVTDASKVAIAAILEQEIDGKNYVIEYASRVLTPAEKNYGSTELECLALVWSVIHFRHYLLAHPFTVITDNHALCWMSSLSNPSGRLARWSCLLNEYTFEIKYRKGKENCASDCLSRYPRVSTALMNITSPESIKKERIIELQRKDTWCSSILKMFEQNGTCPNYSILNGILFRDQMTQFGLKHLLCVPAKLIPEIEYICHDALESGGHLGRNRTIETIRKRFFWPTLYRDVRNYVNECKTCQLKRDRPDKTPGELMNINAEDVFAHIQMDIVGPFRKSARGNAFILTLIDVNTRYADAIALRNITSGDILQALYKRIFLKFGVPKIIQSDRGTQFDSKETMDMLKRIGVEQRFSTAYYPQAQGLIEKFNRTLVSMIRKYVNDNHTNWDEKIDFVVWHYNTTRQDSLGFSPYELVFGREPVLLVDHLVEGMRNANSPYYNKIGREIETIRENARASLRMKQLQQKARYDQAHKAIPANLITPGDYVLIKRQTGVRGLTTKLLSKYIGPFKVVSRVDKNTFLIDLVVKVDTVNVQNLVKYRFRKNANAEERENRQFYRLVRRSSQNEEGESNDETPHESSRAGPTAFDSQLGRLSSFDESGTAGSDGGPISGDLQVSQIDDTGSTSALNSGIGMIPLSKEEEEINELSNEIRKLERKRNNIMGNFSRKMKQIEEHRQQKNPNIKKARDAAKSLCDHYKRKIGMIKDKIDCNAARIKVLEARKETRTALNDEVIQQTKNQVIWPSNKSPHSNDLHAVARENEPSTSQSKEGNTRPVNPPNPLSKSPNSENAPGLDQVDVNNSLQNSDMDISRESTNSNRRLTYAQAAKTPPARPQTPQLGTTVSTLPNSTTTYATAAASNKSPNSHAGQPMNIHTSNRALREELLRSHSQEEPNQDLSAIEPVQGFDLNQSNLMDLSEFVPPETTASAAKRNQTNVPFEQFARNANSPNTLPFDPRNPIYSATPERSASDLITQRAHERRKQASTPFCHPAKNVSFDESTCNKSDNYLKKTFVSYGFNPKSVQSDTNLSISNIDALLSALQVPTELTAPTTGGPTKASSTNDQHQPTAPDLPHAAGVTPSDGATGHSNEDERTSDLSENRQVRSHSDDEATVNARTSGSRESSTAPSTNRPSPSQGEARATNRSRSTNQGAGRRVRSSSVGAYGLRQLPKVDYSKQLNKKDQKYKKRKDKN